MTDDDLDRAFAALHRAAAGRDRDDEAVAAFAGARTQYGIDDPTFVPRYFVDGFAALAARSLRAAEPLTAHDRGHSWMLRELAPAIPGSEFVDHPDGTDYLAVPSLGMALAVGNRGNDETWAIVPWPRADVAPAPSAAPRVLDTFAPTPDQIRAWARDPALRFAEQDEDLAITHSELLPLLIELASDPGGPKRGLLLTVVDRIATMPRPDLVATMTTAEHLARASGDPALQRWADDLAAALHYVAASGPATIDDARRIAKVLMRGPRRPTIVLDESTHGDWTQLRARFPEATTATLDSLYVHLPTGALLWSWAPVDDATLRGLTPGRDAPPTDSRGPVAIGDRGWRTAAS
jgi:hypothetical protein